MALDLHNAIAVNQKLGFARILIDSAQALANNDSIPVRHTITAYLDGASSQLHQAIIYFLGEIAEQDRLSLNIPRHSLSAALTTLTAAEINNALVQELNELLVKPSWLQDLIECNNNPQYLAKQFDNSLSRDVRSSDSSATNLSLLASDKMPSKGPLATVQMWLTNIQNLVERQRSQAVEE